MEINPDVTVTKHKTFYTPETAEQFDFSKYDYIVDAIDTVKGKIALVENAEKEPLPYRLSQFLKAPTDIIILTHLYGNYNGNKIFS